MEAELEKLEYNLGGVRDMKRLPQAALIIDLKSEAIAVRECERLQIPILGLVDSNVDPVSVAFPIPGNDDSMRSCELSSRPSARGRGRRERLSRGGGQAPRARRRSGVALEAEEKARREAEEKARKEAEAQAAAGAAASQPAQTQGQPQRTGRAQEAG